MFNKIDKEQKKQKTGMSRFQVDLRFDNLLGKLKEEIEKVDGELDDAIQAWKSAKRQNQKSEFLRCKDRVSRLLSIKLRKEKYMDKVEAIKYEIDDLFDQLETAKTLTECLEGVSKMTSSKELNSILKRMESFAKIFEKNERTMDAFTRTFEERFDKVDANDDMIKDSEFANTLTEIEESLDEEEVSDFVLE